jgi:hypothetical protein
MLARTDTINFFCHDFKILYNFVGTSAATGEQTRPSIKMLISNKETLPNT